MSEEQVEDDPGPTAHELLLQELRLLQAKAGHLSGRVLAERIGGVEASVVNRALKGAKLPRRQLFDDLVGALNGDLGVLGVLWDEARAERLGKAPIKSLERVEEITARLKEIEAELPKYGPRPYGAPREKPLPELKERYLAGESVHALARSFGVRSRTISSRLREQGVALRGSASAAIAETEQRQLAERNEIVQPLIAAVESELGWAEPGLWPGLRRALEILNSSLEEVVEEVPSTRRWWNFSEGALEAIKDRYLAGESAAAIAATIGCTGQTIRNKLSEMGIGPKDQRNP